ncbi:MAG TPA: thermonuclease family protein [Methanofastidiosum sp.]|nr:thermonuclease family protein [Methanofastidiosum sp.]
MRKLSIIFLLLLVSTCCIDSIKQIYSPDIEVESVLVIKVIDGDTIDILKSGKTERVRLVGIDTPEPYSKNNEKKWYGLPDDHLRKWGVNAFNYTNERLYKKEVNISYDSIQGQKDEFGRTLAYIFIDNNNINLELVQNGYARVYTEKKSDLYFKLIEAETRARFNKLGLWNYSFHDN